MDLIRPQKGDVKNYEESFGALNCSAKHSVYR